MNADGSQLRSLGLHDLVWPQRCGPYLVFTSRSAITRIDLDGGNVKTLATGWSPVCSPDARFVYYAELARPHWKIRRVPIDGGPSTHVVDNPGEAVTGVISISPDGRWLVFPFDEHSPTPVMNIAIVSTSGGSLIRILHPMGTVDAGPRWFRDSKSIQYLLDRDGATNLWEQSLAGAPPHQRTRFASGKIFAFEWSRDGKQLFLCRGHVSADVVLIENPH
jgi:Tol biopolymer transport system component